jgi:proteasome lid subunit RPN8/RPN11
VNGAVAISAQARDALRQRAARGYPREACGLLLGRRGPDRVEVRRALHVRNRAERGARTYRYRIAPEDYLRCERCARRAGLDVVGIWHSHPDGAARPSATDARLAWPRWCYLVAAVNAAGVLELRAWTLHADAFRELELRQCPR